MARLRHANGVVVNVPDEKVDGLLARGFTAEEHEPKPAPKKASSSKTRNAEK